MAERKLNMKLINYEASWQEKGYELPKYDRENVKKATIENPTWLHFGAGNIFRGFRGSRTSITCLMKEAMTEE